jgi:hypothetical protein
LVTVSAANDPDHPVAVGAGRFATEGLPGLDEADNPLDFASFQPWTDESYW